MKLYSSSCLFAFLSFLVSGAPIFASSQATTITDLALADPDLTSLVDLVVMLGLADDLAGAGPFTVFAPTNAAFSAIAGATATMDTAALTRVVTYHVIVGEAIPRNGFVTGTDSTLSGAPIDIAVVPNSNRVIISGGAAGPAQITGTSIVASNGIIHKVDKVLLPPVPVPTVMNGGTGSLEADEDDEEDEGLEVDEGPEEIDDEEEPDEGPEEEIDDEDEPDDEMEDNDED